MSAYVFRYASRLDDRAPRGPLLAVLTGAILTALAGWAVHSGRVDWPRLVPWAIGLLTATEAAAVGLHWWSQRRRKLWLYDAGIVIAPPFRGQSQLAWTEIRQWRVVEPATPTSTPLIQFERHDLTTFDLDPALLESPPPEILLRHLQRLLGPPSP